MGRGSTFYAKLGENIINQLNISQSKTAKKLQQHGFMDEAHVRYWSGSVQICFLLKMYGIS